MWKQHLYSKLVRRPDGGVGGFHVLTEEKEGDFKQFTSRILDRSGRTQERRIAFIMDCGDRFYIGMDGLISTVLGENHPHAYELPMSRKGSISKGREISFVHGYFAPKGTPIPEIRELAKMQPQHLDTILRCANNGEEPVKIEAATFSAGRKPGTDWDRIATEFEKGKHANKAATFTSDGKLFRMLDNVDQEFQKSSERIKSPTLEETSNLAKSSRKGCLRIFAVGLGVILTGLAAWGLLNQLKDKPHKNSKSPVSR